MLIQPSIGRVVLFYPAGHDRDGQPLCAQVTYVHSDAVVNLGFYNQDGSPGPGATSVLLIQPGETLPPSGDVCRWMDYQIEQALKAQTAQSSTPAQPAPPPSVAPPPTPTLKF